MSIQPKKLWSSLKMILAELPSSSEKLTYFRVLAQWTRDNAPGLGPEVVHRYGLDWLAELDASNYPIETADVAVANEIASLVRQDPTRLDIIGMFLRDQLWSLVTLKTTTQCPSCREDNLRALADMSQPEAMVLACDSCGWAQDQDGRRSGIEGTARPATTAELRAHGLIG
jgi:hypothetical protein